MVGKFTRPLRQMARDAAMVGARCARIGVFAEAIAAIAAEGIFIRPDGLPDWPFWKGRRLASERSLVIVFLVGISKPK